VVTTGGASGVVAWDWDGWLEAALNSWRYALWLADHVGSKTPHGPRAAHLQAGKATHMSEAMRRTFEPAGWGRLFAVDLPMAESAASPSAPPPTSLAASPPAPPRGGGGRRPARRGSAPRVRGGGAEPMTAAARRAFAEAFDAPVVDPYGTSENWVMAVSHPQAP